MQYSMNFMFALVFAMLLPTQKPQDNELKKMFTKDYETWYAEYEKVGFGWIMIGFDECPPCYRIKAKLLSLSKEKDGKRNIIYYHYAHKDVQTYKFEEYIKLPIIRGRYPLLLRMEAKNNGASLTYLQGDTTLEKLREFLRLKPTGG